MVKFRMYTLKSKHQLVIIGSLSLFFSGLVLGFANANVLQRLEQDFQRVVTDARPTVVKVVATQVMPVPLPPNIEVPLPSNIEELAFTRQNIGSGIVIDAAGHVVTTTFEMKTPSKIEIIFHDKKVASAKLIGTDILTDIAVLRMTDTPRASASPTHAIKPTRPGERVDPTPARKWGDSSKIDTGSWVVTIGSTYGQSPIVSFGIVGGWDTLPNQLCGELIKINAAVTPGNSGGAVVNTSGEIVGMILAVLMEPTPPNSPTDVLFRKQDDTDIAQLLLQSSPLGLRNQEITFALPIETVHAVAKEIIAHGKVARGWLGVEVDVGELGLFVTDVIENGPAHKGGLLPRDLILEFNEVPVYSYAELLRCVVTKRPDTEVRLKVGRNGTEQHYIVILGEKH